MVNKISKVMRILIKDQYVEFNGRLNKLEVKKKLFLKRANIEKNEEKYDS